MRAARRRTSPPLYAPAGWALPKPGTAGHGHAHGKDGVSTSVRTAVHRGHEIRIETTYAITIDGKPLAGGLEVLDNGAVHYHGLPQYALPSAIDMCKRVLDYFGTEPPAADDLGSGRVHSRYRRRLAFGQRWWRYVLRDSPWVR